jgi:hypothetical protein
VRRRIDWILPFLLAFLLLVPSPARAAATRFDIQASAAQTATANGGGIAVGGIKELAVFFACTASSGTGETLDVSLQSSSDGGTTWYDMAYDYAVTTDGDGTETAPTEIDRDFVNLGADVACTNNALAVYRVFGDYVRAHWFIAGTTPSYTFSLKGIGKN